MSANKKMSQIQRLSSMIDQSVSYDLAVFLKKIRFVIGIDEMFHSLFQLFDIHRIVVPFVLNELFV